MDGNNYKIVFIFLIIFSCTSKQNEVNNKLLSNPTPNDTFTLTYDYDSVYVELIKDKVYLFFPTDTLDIKYENLIRNYNLFDLKATKIDILFTAGEDLDISTLLSVKNKSAVIKDSLLNKKSKSLYETYYGNLDDGRQKEVLKMVPEFIFKSKVR